MLIKGTRHVVWQGPGHSSGPLVPMVRLVPIENDVIPIDYFSCGLAGYRSIPMVLSLSGKKNGGASLLLTC